MQNEPRPFLKWAGGKRRLLPEIDNIMKGAFSSGVNMYVEPFCGGGAVLFHVLSSGYGIRTVASDLNDDLITAYAVVKEMPDRLNKMLEAMSDEYTPLDHDGRNLMFLKARERFNTGELDPVETAALFIFLNKTCFNGLYRVNRSGAFNTPHGRYANPAIHDPDNILSCSRALSGTGLMNFDYRETLRFASPETLYYLDPPYANTKGMYSSVFNNTAMFSWMRGLPCGWALSYDGVNGGDDNTYPVPEYLYSRHEYVESGNSSFKRIKTADRGAVVYESLYIK